MGFEGRLNLFLAEMATRYSTNKVGGLKNVSSRCLHGPPTCRGAAIFEFGDEMKVIRT